MIFSLFVQMWDIRLCNSGCFILSPGGIDSLKVVSCLPGEDYINHDSSKKRID